MIPAPRLQTARLILRPVAASDEAVIVATINDLAISGWLSRVPYPYGVADFRWFLHEIARPGATYAVEDPAGFAGIAGLEHGELGYWFALRAQGMGYATEAARALLAAHFATSRTAVQSGCFEGNARSARVLAKLGFVETGRGLRLCRALGQDRPHIGLRLTAEAFGATP